jgi:hypothetical protein
MPGRDPGAPKGVDFELIIGQVWVCDMGLSTVFEG